LLKIYKSLTINEQLRSEIKKDINRVKGLQESLEKKEGKNLLKHSVSKRREIESSKEPFRGFTGANFFHSSFGFKWSWFRKLRYKIRHKGQDVIFIFNNFFLLGLIVWISFLRGYIAYSNITSKKTDF